MRLPRTTTRRLMAMVAVVGVVLAVVVEGNRLWRQRKYRRWMADHPAFLELAYGGERPVFPRPIPDPVKAAYHGGLRQKWERAASRPWLRVPPDPPEPW